MRAPTPARASSRACAPRADPRPRAPPPPPPRAPPAPRAEQQQQERAAGPQFAHTPSGAVVEIDDWLIDFANLFREISGLDADRHIDFHNEG